MEDWIMAVLFNRPKDRMKNTFYEWILVFLCIYICSIGFSESAASSGKCQHGTFTNGTCVCISGWGDKNCDKCYGRARLSKDEGFITDGQGNYSLATKCSWLIDIPEANQTVWFKFYEFATECGWDHLYIHDGDSSFSPVLAAFSGLILTRNNNSDVGFAASVSSRHMYIHFSSDAAYTMAGFNISYSVTGCFLGCSDHGICDNNICNCNEGFTGQGCETTVCPNNCSSNGDCIGAVCKCKPQYKGDDCSISESEGLWEIVNTELSPGGRASHVAIPENDLMWVVGGYTLTPFSTRNIHRYNFIQKKWSKVREQGPSIPPARYAHASDLHDNKLYMYGGVVNGRVMSDMWVYNIINTNWTQLTSSPYNVSGHTAHIVDGIMYVFFGYSPKYGYMRIVQEYDIANDKWSVPITNGAIVHGGYSHSSVIHVDSSGATCIYVYGGYHSDTQSGYNLTDKLYMYNVRTKTWTVLRSSGSPRYLHSAVVLDGIILIFGGNTHNDTSVSKGAKCYSTDFMAYDIECNSWHFLPHPNLSQNIARYGQSMVQHQGFVYMYGGFNGRMLKDLIKFSPGKCLAINDKDECLRSFPGTKCVWFQGRCATRSHLKNVYIPNCDPSKGGEKICKSYTSCTTCNNTSYDCKWCNNGCFYKNCSTEDNNPPGNCSQSHSDSACDLQHNCYSCIKQDQCRWTNKCMDKIKTISIEGDEVKEDSKIENIKMGNIKDNFEQCELPCSMYTTCENCTGKTCMWCSNMKQCVGTNSYVVSFPYGQCTDWTTKDEKCPATRCSGLRSCSECQANSLRDVLD
ncbi:attractin-like protein 1 [Patella vulgata]|uniref:attractin-like protein 1 n=1 Tax=Patella vulgata TaxID=6465 RepID=UPI00217FF510|nr:attractin-like protein 1 [Patella vulgata]